MSCERVEPELLGFHFDELEAPLRADVERHLEECPACVRRFVALKREVETAESAARPSAQARARLRAAVDAELAAASPPSAAALHAWWERPLALCLAALVLVGCVSFVGGLARRGGAPPYGFIEPVAAGRAGASVDR